MRLITLFFLISNFCFAQNFTLDQIKSYPFPNELTGASDVSRIAWAFDEKGKRNIYVAQAPDFIPRRLTSYMEDTGQELSSVSMSADGNWVTYVRGGDFGSNWDDELPVNPTFNPNPPKVQIWSIPFSGGDPIMIDKGINPVISPLSNEIAYIKDGQIWISTIHGKGDPKKIFHSRGRNGSHSWSPDGSKIAFVSNRGDRSFIGIYDAANLASGGMLLNLSEKSIKWINPSFDRDYSPRWSPDGSEIVYIRQPGAAGKPSPILGGKHNPWKIVKTDINSMESKELWTAPKTLRGSYPRTQGGTNLHWASNRIVFLSYHDGWQHLYSISEDGGNALLLTPGDFMCEYIKLSPDKKFIVFTANTGNNKYDIDRRHVVRVSVDKSDMKVLTNGIGLEWTPLVTGDLRHIVYISATSSRPPLPTIMNLKTNEKKILFQDRIPTDFPLDKMVTPTQIKFKSLDSIEVHATKFEKDDNKKNKPAVIYIHGGPPRQMLLGWHYSSYYSNAYALNQYLANKGFVVISVNYRLGIGYGYEFHNPIDGGTRGASEYKDIKAAGLWLREQNDIDKSRVYVYGGSYGGYLTAMALGRDSGLFSGGVDIHGVHDRTRYGYLNSNYYEKSPDYDKARETAWESSPVADVDTWESPVLIIHADDDRNVDFRQSTDLVQRLRDKKVYMETMVIVDDTHHFMMFDNQMKVNKATADFLIRLSEGDIN
ncbi:MAG: prolyl oligopeptidase family serine peptidase [Cytophagales bacterium]|nr:prolyl oligopeptidase family serine peptidase [Cytophagales bacterium]